MGLLTAGGIKCEQSYGASDKDNPSREKDAVSFRISSAKLSPVLGLPIDKEFMSKSGRSLRVADDGQSLRALFS